MARSISSWHWGPSSDCLCRMIEDVGFAVRRMRVTPVPANADRDDPAAWTIF